MAIITNCEMVELLESLNAEFGGDTLRKTIDAVKRKKCGYNNENKSISFYGDSIRENFNWQYLSIIFPNKNIQTSNISKIEITKDKKNIILEDIFGKKYKIPYNKDIFISVEKVPIDEFLDFA